MVIYDTTIQDYLSMNETRTQLRMPEDTHKWITQRANQNDRSMNAEIVRILKAEQQREEQQKAA